MIIQEKSIPHIFRNKYLRDLGGAVMVGGSGGGTVTTVGGDYLPANLYESETYKVDYNTEFLKNLTVNGDTNLKNTNIDGDINLTGTIYVNGEEFKGGSGADLETIDKIDEIEENLNILVDEYKKSGYRYSFSKAKDNWFGFTTFVAFPEKQLWNYRYNWQIKGDVHIYTKDFNAIYYVYATGDLSKDGTLTLSDSSCFAIGERRVPVVSVRLGGISYSEDHPTNPAAHVGFTFRTPLRLDVVAFSHFDLTAYNPNNAGEDWIEYPASEVDYMPLLYDTDGTSAAPDPDKDYSFSSMLNDAFIPVVKMANSLSDLGITATPNELNVLDGVLINTTELNYLLGVDNNIQKQFDKLYRECADGRDRIGLNAPLTPEQGYIFIDLDHDLNVSIGNLPLYQTPVPDSWDGYRYVNCNVGYESTAIDAFWGICMEFEPLLWPDEAEIWVRHNEIWGRVYLSEGYWYADKNAASWFAQVSYCRTSLYGSAAFYLKLETDSVGVEFRLGEEYFGQYEAYVKATGLKNASYRETMPYFNVINNTFWHINYNVTDEVFISDDYFLENDKPVYKLYTKNNIHLLGIDKLSTQSETKLLGDLTLGNGVKFSGTLDELIISAKKIKGFYNSEETLALIDSITTDGKIELTNYYTKSEADNKYFLKNDMPDLTLVAYKSDIPKDYLTSIPSEYITETELDEKGYLTSIPSEYITEDELLSKGYITEHQSIEHLATKELLVNYLPKGDYLTEIPLEYAKEEDLKYYFVPLLNRLDIVESALGDIELILDKIIGEDDSYLVKTLNEIIG